MTRTSWRSVLLAVVILGSVVGGAVGPALGQQTGTYTHTYTDSDRIVKVDVGSYSGSINIEFSSPEAPQGTIWAGTLSGAQIDNGEIALLNQGAYDEIQVTVSGPSTAPTYTQESYQGLRNEYMVGATGGDADQSCDTLEQANSAVGLENLDCTGWPGIEEINTTNTDAQQVRGDIYGDASTSATSADNSLTVLENYLNDTATSARIIGQNAYIRALNNGTSQAEARIAAQEAVQDYYATKQRNLISTWNTQVSQAEYLRSVAVSEEGLTNRTVRTLGVSYTRTPRYPTIESFGTTNHTLVNQETVETRTWTAGMIQNYGTTRITLTSGPRQISSGSGYDQYTAGGIEVQRPDSSYSNVTTLRAQRYLDLWNDIEAQNNRVEDDMAVLVNNTYSQYQSNDINNSDLVDPYTLSRRSPGESYQSWASAQLTALDANSPEALESTGAFVVNISGGPTREGILFVGDETTISAGETYNSSNLAGTEYVVGVNDTHELTGTWTVENITTRTGESVPNATYQDTTYQSENVSELIAQYETLAEERQEIEAREQEIIANSGVPPSSGGATDRTTLLAVVGISGGLVVLLIVTNQ